MFHYFDHECLFQSRMVVSIIKTSKYQSLLPIDKLKFSQGIQLINPPIMFFWKGHSYFILNWDNI